MRTARTAAVVSFLGAVLCASSCRRTLSRENAEALVRRYNERLIEAYRAGDAQLMEGLVAEMEGRKLTGLIGAKLDLGITLDATLQEFTPSGMERTDSSVELLTEERWHYRDRRIGTGETVGPRSTDQYRMRYVLQHLNGAWVVAAVRFETPPDVGRAAALEAALDSIQRARAR